MRSFRLIVMLAVGLGLAPQMVLAQSQAERNQQESLRRLLEEKYGNRQPAPATRSLGSPRSSGNNNDDIRIIRPDGTIQKPGGTGRDQRSDLGTLRGGVNLAASLTGAPAVNADTATQPQLPLVLAQAGQQQVVSQNSYVIQLSLNATSAQIDALLAKYGLEVERYVASLGLLYVRSKSRPSASTRSVGKESLQSLLEPRIIVDLRKEPIVDSAYVNSSINTKSVPRGSDVKAPNQRGSQTLRWHWQDGTDDGNWGHKAMRMPPVWTILKQVRASSVQSRPASIIFLDVGFGPHPQLSFAEVQGNLPAGALNADCGRSHGTHVAGIVGATFGQGKGIDGMVPGARLAAVPVKSGLLEEALGDGLEDPTGIQTTYFFQAILDLQDYVDSLRERQLLSPNHRHVVNISLAYNWGRVSGSNKVRPPDLAAVRSHVREHAKTIYRMVNQVRDSVLFVVAAGNDSDGAAAPSSADLATPFAFAANAKSKEFTPPASNILVVEARNRNGARASFSNVGGHVSAPGVDIMSTFNSDRRPFGVCDGTSQAAPHVSSLAAILFEVAPEMKPNKVAELLRTTAAVPQGADSVAAPMVDALSAVLKAVPGSIRILADLNKDGKVDQADLEIFRDHMLAIEEARYGAEPYKIDLNGDGVVDRNEACFPRIDLNGSGRASYDPNDKRPIDGVMRSDVEVIELAWTDTTKSFKQAMADSGLEELISAWQETRIVAAAAQPGVRPPCN